MTHTFKQRTSWLSVAFVNVLVTACGGGNGGQAGPTISAVANQSVNQDTTLGPLSVTVGAGSMPLGQLTLTASSSNPQVVPSEQIVVTGDGTARNLSITPAMDATGTTQITLSVKDEAGRMANRSFQLAVNAVYASFKQRADSAFGGMENSIPIAVNGLTFDPDADNNPDAFTTQLQ